MTRVSTILVLGCALLLVLVVPACGQEATKSRADPCAETILEVDGRIEPETSEMTCGEIKHMISSVPVSPGGYLMTAGTPPKRWKCHRYPSVGTSSDLLTCVRGDARFAVRRSKKS